MKRLLLAGMLCPAIIAAQEVKPILSPDYLALIHHDSASVKGKLVDSTNSMRAATLHFTNAKFYGEPIKRISIGKDNTVVLHPLTASILTIGGSYSANLELQQSNHNPALQNQYVQGRNVNGTLTWRGPETNELFSYGPAVTSLEFDGSSYPYDRNGRLVNSGTGTGKKAEVYNNTILRKAALIAQSLNVYAKYSKSYNPLITLSLSAGQRRDNTFISSNKNRSDNFSVSTELNKNRINLKGMYNFQEERFNHNNRNGFLNRAYQNSLLSPISFDSRQGDKIGNAPRTYSNLADNPFFLLHDEGHSYLQQLQTAALASELKFNYVRIKLNQSLENVNQHSAEGYQPGTAFFPAGTDISRTSRNRNYTLNSNISYRPYSYNGNWRSQFSLSYILNSNASNIGYSNTHKEYHYQRTANNAVLTFSPDYNGSNMDAGMMLGNKFYSSNTGPGSWWLPQVSWYTLFNKLFDHYNFRVKLFGSFNRFNSEIPVSQSFASSSLLQYSVANAGQYLPVTEVNSFDKLSPVKHREFTTGADIDYKGKVSFNFNWFSRQTNDDIFPVVNGNELNLVNMAGHRSRGVEMQVFIYSNAWKHRKIEVYNNISFSTYRTKVTSVAPGYNFTPLAGFSDIHKTLIAGEPLGVITGSTWLRDAAGNRIIDNDGFPLVNLSPSVIGDPTPDFLLKWAHRITYKGNWDLNIDWEWKKGGDTWNGTQAMLDYYGRSANTGDLRNTRGYVFEGVSTSGTHNTKPVSFYDPSLPLSQNRWVRYGPGSVGEDYIQKADCIRFHTIALSWHKNLKKYIQRLSFSVYVNNLIAWSAYKGVDPDQLLNDQPGTAGLDFFNLPAMRTAGFNVALQF